MRGLPAFLGCALPAPAAAQQVQPWPDVFVTMPLGGGWSASGEVIGRVAGDQRPSQFETRAQIGHRLGKRFTVWVGWVHVATFPPQGPTRFEDQAVEQLNWNIATMGRLSLTTRTRLEQRSLTGVSATSWRYRQQVRAVVALGGRHAPSAVAWIEPFLSLNRTQGQTRTLDQLRTFAGLTVPLSPRIDLEVGYLNQRLYRPEGTTVNDVIPLILNVRL